MNALLLIDLQAGAFDGLRCPAMPDGDALIATCQRLLAQARLRGDRVVWVQHAGGPGAALERGTPGFALHPRLLPLADEAWVVKTEASAFEGTGLAELLRGLDAVWVAGLQSEACVRATVLAGHAQGLPMRVVADGHGTWPADGMAAVGVRDGVNAELAAVGVRLGVAEAF